MTSTTKLQAYFLSTKPGLLFGNLLTALAGYFLSPPSFDFLHFLYFILAMLTLMGSSALLNNLYDHEHDALMERTKKRPLPQNALSRKEGYLFAFFLFAVSLTIFLFLFNALALFLGLIALITYMPIYTIAKYKTPYAVFIGALAGALPPLIGFAASHNTLSLGSFFLFTTLFLWQIPHFYAIGLFRSDDYKKVGIPLYPIVKGEKKSRQQILLFILLYALSLFLLYFSDAFSWISLTLLSLLNLYWLFTSLKQTPVLLWSKKTFRISLIAITLLSIAIIFHL
jgi:protoheme IX farnesyltransferase